MIVLLLITLLIIVPAAVALLSDRSMTPQLMMTRAFGIGAPIVYTRQEMSTNPSADARDVCPSERGEFYYYNLVDYLRVTEVLDDGRVIAVARDNNRLFLGQRFPVPQSPSDRASDPPLALSARLAFGTLIAPGFRDRGTKEGFLPMPSIGSARRTVRRKLLEFLSAVR